MNTNKYRMKMQLERGKFTNTLEKILAKSKALMSETKYIHNNPNKQSANEV